MAGKKKRRNRRVPDASRKSRHNKSRYRLKEEAIVVKNYSRSFEESMDNQVVLSDREMDAIVESIVQTGDPSDTYEPFLAGGGSPMPKGSNSDNSKKLYYRRKYYKDYAWPKPAQSQDIMDPDIPDDNAKYRGHADKIFAPFQYEDLMYDKTFYGRVDTQNYPIYPKAVPQKILRSVTGTHGNVVLLNFVADAANAMIKKIEALKRTGKLERTSVYYGFKVEKGYKNFVNEHHGAIKALYDAFVENWLTAPARFGKVYNFSTFSQDFVDFLNLLLPRFPITRGNLLIRKTTSPLVSGIMFEISKAKHDEDQKKHTDYINDKHFLMMQSIANGFGFMVDKNAPWRFIADLESPPMKDRMAAMGFDSLQQMFDKQYYKAHLHEVNSIRDYLLSFYDSYATAYPYYTIVEKDGEGSKAKLLYREKRSKNPFEEDKKLLEFYYFLRAKEGLMGWSQEMFDVEVDRAYKVFQKYGFIEALNYISDKTTFMVGDGANFGNKIKIEEGKRIIYNHQPSYKRTSFTMKI